MLSATPNSAAQASIRPTVPNGAPPRSKCQASLNRPYFDFFNLGYSPTFPCILKLSTGRMYHRSRGIRYAATKSNGSPVYFPRHPRTVTVYPPRSKNIVDFTCTRTKCALYSTAKSYRDISPQGRVTHKPCSAARVIKHISAHSPRNLGCLIFIPLFFISYSLSLPNPSPCQETVPK